MATKRKPRSWATTGDLQAIPGVGPSIAQDLKDLGYSMARDLRNEDPEKMYLALCKERGVHQDRCVLYVFRCAVYFVSNDTHDAELLKWWNWKDSSSRNRRRTR